MLKRRPTDPRRVDARTVVIVLYGGVLQARTLLRGKMSMKQTWSYVGDEMRYLDSVLSSVLEGEGFSWLTELTD